ncbi:MAG: hypothetical protein OEM63_12690 [Gammaproteobacteria bacterium]|nr:hypothetical protein [Gammaproteobacteria bacterium]
MFNKPTTVAIAGSLLIGLWPFSSVLADEVDDAKAERCILITRIANTHVLDDRRILFYMRGKKAYLNLLPHRCGGLGMQRRFMYETSQSQLCDLDTISVLYNRGGGFSRGATCGLGLFHPMTVEDADALRNAEPPEPEAEELPTAEPEEIGEPQ